MVSTAELSLDSPCARFECLQVLVQNLEQPCNHNLGCTLCISSTQQLVMPQSGSEQFENRREGLRLNDRIFEGHRLPLKQHNT